MDTSKFGQIELDFPRRLKTTLYDLITVLQAVAKPDEDALIVAIVVHWLRTGQITFLR